MNKRINILIAIGGMVSILSSNFFVVSARIDKPIQPNPISGELTNEKINKYNEEVEKYNEQVDNYNEQLDEDYDKELESVKQQNEKIKKHNEEEQTKVQEIEKNNAALTEQYNKDLEQYNKDLEKEKEIIAKGYESVEQYNNLIQTQFNDPANKSVEENSDTSAIFSIDDSYVVEEYEEETEDIEDENDEESEEEEEEEESNSIKVYIEHNFVDVELTYSTTIEIENNDTITFYAAGAQLEPTQPGFCTFYMYTDSNHVMGYWTLTDSKVECTANINQDGWNCGDTHIISYREGKLHPSDNTDIYMTYNYSWVPLQTYDLYNVPIEPKLELQEYTPNLLDYIAEPVKPTYLTHLEEIDEIDDEEEEDEEEDEDDEEEEEDDEEEEKDEKKKKKKESQKQQINNEEQQQANNAATQPSTTQSTPTQQITPASTPAPSIVVIPQQPKQTSSARQYATGDHTITNFRIIIIIICIILIIIFFPWKRFKKKK